MPISTGLSHTCKQVLNFKCTLYVVKNASLNTPRLNKFKSTLPFRETASHGVGYCGTTLEKIWI